MRIADVNMQRKKTQLTRFLFMHNASCTGVNSVCQLPEGEVIDAALSICHLIMPPQQILNRGAVIKYVDLLEFTTTWPTITFWLTYIQVQ